MPLFDYVCLDCGKTSEILIVAAKDSPLCRDCGSSSMQKQLSAPSSLTGQQASRFPGPKDTACCGSSPGQAQCAGPGSCCGKH
ncbi:MAG: zinc ribbon domain-containing protein [Desulfobacterium sp.]|nr:zinc ribbon domain-containing protein [Desulfobacterium sp.]MBU3950314.1 zinc ribbon domain-containing protein [Pseudomonadota bacterium]MBU4011612.1 zinc ribbon domain-containing protein [Pseudomonadota bacterium]MBU4035020.1 zinc ribbon domain-containing protein [Pseudomonadota bacterium]